MRFSREHHAQSDSRDDGEEGDPYLFPAIPSKPPQKDEDDPDFINIL